MPVYRRNDRYPMVRIESAQDWQSLLELCDGHLDEERLDQLQTLLGKACKTVVVERDYVCKDYRDTFTNYYAKKFATYPDKCTRLFFFRKAVGPRSWWNVESSVIGVVSYWRNSCRGGSVANTDAGPAAREGPSAGNGSCPAGPRYPREDSRSYAAHEGRDRGAASRGST